MTSTETLNYATLITLAKAEPLIRRAQTLVDLATRIVRSAP